MSVLPLVDGGLNLLWRPYWVKKQVVKKKNWLRIIASYKMHIKKAENNSKNQERESCFEMLFTQTSSVLQSSCFREKNKIK